MLWPSDHFWDEVYNVTRRLPDQLPLFEESSLPSGEIPAPHFLEINERELASLAVALGAREIPGWSDQEEKLAKTALPVKAVHVEVLRRYILAGRDPLGAIFSHIRVPEKRRENGATFTPWPIVNAMFDWATLQLSPSRVTDPGVGSGRYLLRAARYFPHASLIGVELDPLCAMMARANLAVVGKSKTAEIVLGDYRAVKFPPISGKTLYIGNPPYVRHHLIEPKWKEWLSRESRALGLNASQLAGLHVHFILSTILHAKSQDYGAFITAAEWLDVNYGSLVRELFLGPLGGKRIVVVEPTAHPFPDAETTAAITYFEIGSKAKSVRLKRVQNVAQLKDHNGNRIVRRERLESERRWSHLTHTTPAMPEGFIELGELCRVHRGQVTGANRVWIAGPHAEHLPPSVLFATVTKARELFGAGKRLEDSSSLRSVIDLPIDLDAFESDERRAINKFLQFARNQGADQCYVATNRKAWWSVGLREPAPILATYMARRPPAFVRNVANARHINIAHGLYPREVLSERVLNGIVNYLSGTAPMRFGRTYCGGLTKFEPREMERLPIPSPHILAC
ncbi:MAG: N-6 DNA methylase [Chthoniobacter sp.]|uniref:Eco57I restriction-modification methylase domain-containing protein n=1 Tax=Chthoniobacter sp. TaxID=2510640 RepID=UPI0032AA2963